MLVGEGTDPAFNFGAPNGTAAGKKKPAPMFEFDSIEELSKGDTPQMERNKLMRAGYSRSQSHTDGEGSSTSIDKDKNGKNGKSGKAGKAGKGHTKKSSVSNRGKRISSLFEGGVICEFLSLFDAFLYLSFFSFSD
jgi:kinetochore protein Mis13/DSN1